MNKMALVLMILGLMTASRVAGAQAQSVSVPIGGFFVGGGVSFNSTRYKDQRPTATTPSAS